MLLLHNRYRFSGGEDVAAGAEADLLRERGIDVRTFEERNEFRSAAQTVKLVWDSSWSRRSYASVQSVCRQFRPDVAHVHNFWMGLTPSVHAACHDAGVPTVQTLHNYRLLCVNALLLRDDKVCEDCIGRAPWPGVVHRCYRNSGIASAAMLRMILENRARKTWIRHVQAFITPSEYSRSKFIAAGMRPDNIFVKPNVVPDSDDTHSRPSASRMILYSGRLSEEKGLPALLDAWSRVPDRGDACLCIAGGGPSRDTLRHRATGLGIGVPVLEFVGEKSRAEIRLLLASARAAVLPSVAPESFSMTAAEALSMGRPVIASRHGALEEIVRHGQTGWLVPPGDVDALSGALTDALHDPVTADRLGEGARREYLKSFSTDRNFETLIRIYGTAIGEPARWQSSRQDACGSAH